MRVESTFLIALLIVFEKCLRFVLMVRKGYRDPPYHNWMHAFSVFHFTYVLIKRLRLVQQEYLT